MIAEVIPGGNGGRDDHGDDNRDDDNSDPACNPGHGYHNANAGADSGEDSLPPGGGKAAADEDEPEGFYMTRDIRLLPGFEENDYIYTYGFWKLRRTF